MKKVIISIFAFCAVLAAVAAPNTNEAIGIRLVKEAYAKAQERAASEYTAKFNKMSLVTDYINVLVANSSDHQKMQDILYQWACNHKNDPIIAQKTIRLSSFHVLKTGIENGKPFEEWWFVSERVANFPAAKDM